MDKFSQEIKTVLNATMTEQSIFSETEKRIVLKKIKINQRKERRLLHWVPKTLSAISVIGFVVLLGGIASQKLVFKDQGNQSNLSSGAIIDDIKIGEKINGWELKNTGDPESTYFDTANTIFEGKATIKGTLLRNKTHDEHWSDMVFIPYKNYLNLLPIKKGTQPEIKFSTLEEENLRFTYKILPGTKLENVSLEISNYISTYKKGEELPDEATIEKIIVPEEMYPIGMNEPIEFDAHNKLILSPGLLELYDKVADTNEDKYLEYVPPRSVFKLFFYAEQLKDYKTQYILINQERNKQYLSLKEYLKYVKKPNIQEYRQKALKTLGNQSETSENLWGDLYDIRFKEDWAPNNPTIYQEYKDKNNLWKVDYTSIDQ